MTAVEIFYVYRKNENVLLRSGVAVCLIYPITSLTERRSKTELAVQNRLKWINVKDSRNGDWFNLPISTEPNTHENFGNSSYHRHFSQLAHKLFISISGEDVKIYAGCN